MSCCILSFMKLQKYRHFSGVVSLVALMALVALPISAISMAQAAPAENMGVVTSAVVTPYVDVPADYDFRVAIQSMKDKKIIKGYPDQTFKPEVAVSRAEFLKMAIQLSGRTADISKMKNPFKDVHSDDWFFSVVMTAQKLGVASGYGDGNFGPNDTITRAQALKLGFLAMQFSTASAPKTVKALSDLREVLPPDISFSSWFYPYAMTARTFMVMTDDDQGNFNPNATVTRGMAAEILYRISQVQGTGGAPFDLSSTWSTMSAPTLGMTLKIAKNWDSVIETGSTGGRLTIWKRNPSLPFDHDTITPMTAKISFLTPVPEASTSAAEYFGKVKTLMPQIYPNREIIYADVVVSGNPGVRVKITADGIENWYVYIAGKNGIPTKSMSIYSQYGMSSLMPKLRESVRLMAKSLVLTPVTNVGSLITPDEKLRGVVQAKVLIQGAGRSAINSLGDAFILQTDEVGVGTGAVDYYYSEVIQMTLKYERASDTILAVRTGKTSAF